MSKWSIHGGGLCAAALLAASACDGDGDNLSTAEVNERLAELELPDTLPASPTNAYADNAGAAELGRKLFFDRRLSSDGTVACVTCHDPAQGFSDTKRLSEGVRGQEGTRHSMPITTAALQPFLLWDGRAGTVWRQPLFALENELEMDFTRTDVALFVAAEVRAEYEEVFGPLPALDDVPAHARPGDARWEELSEETRDSVQRVFVNVGKSLEAYERLLVCKDTRFDQWLRGEVDLTSDELDGAERFVRRGCVRCHDGPALSDGKFHNLGLSRQDDARLDTGREAGLALLVADDLNAASRYSDDPEAGASHIAAAREETGDLGAFRTASLRGVTQRPRFGHLGEHTDLEAFIQDTYNRRGRGGRGRAGRDGDNDDDNEIVGALDPILDDVNANNDDAEAIVEFLRTTECAPLPPELLE